MSQYIVDASIMAQLFITDTYSAETKLLFKGLNLGDTLHIPEFGLLECTNVIWKQVRFAELSQADADVLVNQLLALNVAVTPVIGLLPRALEIGLKHKLAIYDSTYIALAEKLTYPLITADRRQAKASQAEGITLKDIADFTS
jgi:predicted nucleic acid-binding protein